MIRLLAVGAVLTLLLLFQALVSSVVITVPLATDEQLRRYAEIAKEMDLDVPWHHLAALDAVRNRQDFSRVTEASIRQTAALFVACRRELLSHEMEWRFDYPGDAIRYPLHLPVAGTVRWEVQAYRGKVRAQLLDSLDKPISGEGLGPGWYVLLVYAEEAPAPFRLMVQVGGTDKACYGRTLDDVMDELGFPEFDRQMAKHMVNAF